MALWLAAPPLIAAPPEPPAPAPVAADWILARLARPTPMRTGFVELRESSLLKQPLRIVGEYRRPDDATLVREVRSPYRETTTIRAGQVEIRRDGDSVRRFSLSRAPQLAALRASFDALLGGDRDALRRHYRVRADGPRQHWTLVLTPKAAEQAARLRSITLYGRGAELRCIETRLVDDNQPQRTLLAGAARDAAGIADRGALTALCHGDGAAAQ